MLLIAGADLKDQVAADLAKLRFERSFDNTSIGIVKDMINAIVRTSASTAFHRLEGQLRPEVSAAEVEQALSTSVFDGIETKHKELAYLAKEFPVLKHRVVRLTKKHSIASFSMIELICRQLKEDPQYRKMVRAASDRYKMGSLHKVQATHFYSHEDGYEIRNHPHALRKATEEERNDLRLLLAFNCDDVEVSSWARGQGAILSLSFLLTTSPCVSPWRVFLPGEGLQRARCKPREAQAVRLPSGHPQLARDGAIQALLHVAGGAGAR